MTSNTQKPKIVFKFRCLEWKRKPNSRVSGGLVIKLLEKWHTTNVLRKRRKEMAF